jgi:hypothetical protein
MEAIIRFSSSPDEHLNGLTERHFTTSQGSLTTL